MSVYKRLPVELWHKIFRFLHTSDVKSFSITSHHARSLAVPLLFKSISLRFGRFTDPLSPQAHIGSDNWKTEKEEEEVGKSLDVLLKLEDANADDSDLVLSNWVQALQIIVIDAHHPLVFEKYHVQCALRKLTHLRHFSWIDNCQGAFDIAFAEELSSCCPDLQTLYVPCCVYPCASEMRSMCSLRSLELIDKSAIPHPIIFMTPPSEAVPNIILPSEAVPNIIPPSEAVQNMICRNRLLKKLALPYFIVRPSILKPIGASLTHLAVNGVRNGSELALFLREASVLESLALLDVRCLAFLPCQEDILPKLRDLKLRIDHFDDPYNYGPVHTKPDMNHLAKVLLEFIYLHRNLRRFDFSLWPTLQWENRYFPEWDENIEENITWFSDVLDAVCALHGVRALGLSFPGLHNDPTQHANIMHEMLTKLIKNSLSLQTCTALRLGGVSHSPVQMVTDQARQSTFLALSNSRPMETVIPIYPLPTVEELVLDRGHSQLEQACIGGQMYDIIASPRMSIQPWSSERIRVRTEMDFNSADAYWLMSYRTIGRRHDYADVAADDDDPRYLEFV